MIDEWQRAYDQSTMIGLGLLAFSTEGSALTNRGGTSIRIAVLPWCTRGESLISEQGAAKGFLRLLCDEDAAHKNIVATEGWGPNFAVAQEALGERGVAVVSYDSERDARLPFPDSSLDLVMSRHESIDAREIARVLSPGGRLLTQQVDGHDAPEIHEWFGAAFEYPHVSSHRYVEDIAAAGLRVDVVDDWRGMMEFADAETLVSYLALVPWDAPHFSVEEHAPQLIALDADRPIRVSQYRFRVYATKP